MDIAISQMLFENLFSNVKGYDLSYRARKKLNHYSKSYTYGEITFESFAKLLASAKPQPGEVFYDLGSGSGKAVIAASMLYPFGRVCGIEILDDLYMGAEEIKQKYKETVLPQLNQQIQKCRIEFIKNDFNLVDFSDADIIFIHATCFDAELGLSFIRQAELLKPGTRILTASKKLHLPTYIATELGRFNFTWGQTDCFLHIKN